MIVTLNPSADARILSDSATTNYGTSTTLDAGEWYGGISNRRALIKFDLSSYTGRLVTKAKLRLYDTGDDYTNTGSSLINLFRVRRNWTSAGVTWNKYDGTNDWTSAGASDTNNDIFSDADLTGLYTLPNPAVAGYIDLDLPTRHINNWLNGSVTNYGFLISTSVQSDDLHVFNSSDAGSNSPELVLTFRSAGYIPVSV